MKNITIRTLLACSVLGLAVSGTTAFADDTHMASDRDKAMMGHDADNTGRNVRDRNPGSVLPEDQSNDEALVKRTAAIRKEIVNRGDLSVQAHNIKIITITDGTVVLRGPVKSAAEKEAIETIARRVAGTAPVRSMIEIDKM